MISPMTTAAILEILIIGRHMWKKLNWLHDCENAEGRQTRGRTEPIRTPMLVDQMLRKPQVNWVCGNLEYLHGCFFNPFLNPLIRGNKDEKQFLKHEGQWVEGTRWEMELWVAPLTNGHKKPKIAPEKQRMYWFGIHLLMVTEMSSRSHWHWQWPF